jgi:hypothetical protein
MHKYRELKVWQRGMAFTVAVYRETGKQQCWQASSNLWVGYPVIDPSHI